MIDFGQMLNLPLIWIGIIAFAIFMYVFLDGFDLGIGILFPFAPSDECRARMMMSIAPFWDGNETWLVLGGGGLFAAFPLAYAVLLPAFYLPILIMLVALVFRGVAFEFRFKSSAKMIKLWDLSFHFGSLIAGLMQGMIIGAYIDGVDVTNEAFSGVMFDWVTPFTLISGIGLIAGYTLLGSTWLIIKTNGITQKWARKVALYSLLYVLFFMALVSLMTPIIQPKVFHRWFAWPNIAYLSILPILVVVFSSMFVNSIKQHHEFKPFIYAICLFMLGYLGLAISLWPWLVPYEITFTQSAAIATSQSLLLMGAVIIMPIILLYTAYAYYVFRGKTYHNNHY